MVESAWNRFGDDVLRLLIDTHTLSVPEILAFSKVCRRTQSLSNERDVWVNAWKIDILQKSIPFPSCCLSSFSDLELRERVTRAYFLAQNLTSSSPKVQRIWTAEIQSGIWTGNSIKALGKTWIIVVSGPHDTNPFSLLLLDCITSKLVCKYDLGADAHHLVTNSNPHAKAAVVINVSRNGRPLTEFLSIHEDITSTVSFECVHTIDHTVDHTIENLVLRPISLHGDMFASEQGGNLVIQNWKTGQQFFLGTPADLRTEPSEVHHVAFVRDRILVIRADSVWTFNKPSEPGAPALGDELAKLQCLTASLAFESMSSCDSDATPSLASVLIGAVSSDGSKELQLWTTNGSQTHSPDSSLPHHPDPPLFLSSTYPSLYKRWPGIVCGPAGSAIWRNMDSALEMVVFPGPYNKTKEVQPKVEVNTTTDGICDHFDYDEEEGLMMVYRWETLMVFSLCPLDRPVVEVQSVVNRFAKLWNYK